MAALDIGLTTALALALSRKWGQTNTGALTGAVALTALSRNTRGGAAGVAVTTTILSILGLPSMIDRLTGFVKDFGEDFIPADFGEFSINEVAAQAAARRAAEKVGEDPDIAQLAVAGEQRAKKAGFENTPGNGPFTIDKFGIRRDEFGRQLPPIEEDRLFNP